MTDATTLSVCELMAELSETKAQLKSRDTTIATLREALEPFASAAGGIRLIHYDGDSVTFRNNFGENFGWNLVRYFRKAKAAYDASKAEKNTLPKCECGKPNNVSCYNPDCCRRA
jgi:hypothetical protein